MSVPINVLIVEDSEDDALLVVRELRKGGYDPVYERVDTEKAMLDALGRQSWDIVIADYVMPHFSGLQALKLLQEKEIDLPFIIVSGKIGEDVAVEAMKAGAHDYVVKGNLARLNQAISRELREAAIRRERKKAEKELAEKRELLKLVTDHIPQFIFWKDRYFSLMGCNRLLAKNPNNGNGSNCYIPWKQDEEDLERERRIMETNEPEVHVVQPVEMHDGRQAWLDISRVPLHDAEGHVIGLLGVFEDITQRKLAEEELEQRRQREQQIRAEAEEAKKQFYRGTIASVTNGKLNLVSYDEIEKLLAPDLARVSLRTGQDLSDLRARVALLADSIGLDEENKYALTLAAGEAAANAVKHVGEGTALVGLKDGVIQICIQDKGPGIDSHVLPKATLMMGFSTKPSMGLGYSLILSSVDTVYLATDKQGTWVLMEKAANSDMDETSHYEMLHQW